MGPGRLEHEPANQSLRLMPQPDGYGDYVDQAGDARYVGGAGPTAHADSTHADPSQADSAQADSAQADTARGQARHRSARGRLATAAWPGRAGQRRGESAARQRSIRSTMTILLVIPLLSLAAIWAYAAVGTIGPALAKQHADTLNQDIGAPLQNLIQQLDTERGQTFVWQNAHGALPRTGLIAQRARTDAAIAAFRAGEAKGIGVAPAAAKPLAAALLASLDHLSQVRVEVDAGRITPLAAFAAYNAVPVAIYPFADALTNPDEPLSLYQKGQAVLQEGEAEEEIAQEATLVGGALVAGGTMSPAEHQAFVTLVDDQRLLEQLGTSPLYWQQSPDPYLPVFASADFAGFRVLENKIVDARAGTLLPVSPLAWQAGVTTVLTKLTAAETVGRLGVTSGDTHAGDVVLLRLIVVGGAGLAAVVISSLLLLGFGNRISREMTGLRGAVRALAHDRLPSVVSRLRAGDDVDVDAEVPPLTLGTRTREVTETADAFSAVQRTAVEAAVEQARLRKGVSLVFRSLARRNQSLVQRQLKMLDEMERATEDPEALSQLFRLDHLTTRMRRQAEGLIILSGAAPGRGWREPVPVVEVLRGAIGEIEDFARVDLITESPDFLQGPGVADVTHLLAELVENAVLYSPPTTRVQVRSGRVANGFVIEVEDRGLGIPQDTMAVLNDRLARPPEFDLADSDQLGLFVVSRLAARHQIKVTLRASAYGGTLAIVLFPHSLVVSEDEVVFLAAQHEVAARTLAPVPPARAEWSHRPAAPPSQADRAGSGSPEAESGALPRREPMANMAPQLRENRQDTPRGPLSGRSPEQARALLSSIRQGWRSGLSDAAGAAPDEESRT